MKILITGGAGFIGSHVVSAFVDRGDQVTVIDDLSSGRLSNLGIGSRINLIKKDITKFNPEETGRIDAIVHLAASPFVVDSWNHYHDCHYRNLTVGLSIIDIALQLNVSKVVFASSAAVYGNPSRIPIQEESEKRPLSPYGLQKWTCEQYYEMFSKRFGLSIAALRFFNVYGPRQNPLSPYSGVISIFCQAIQDDKEIKVYGDGHQTRDFIFVKDVASACMCAVDNPLPIGLSSFNIGTGKGVSILELVDSLSVLITSWNKRVVFCSKRDGDISASIADVSLAKMKLGFEAETKLYDGLMQYLEYKNRIK